METSEETRTAYLAVMKHVLEVSDEEAFKSIQAILPEITSELNPSEEYKGKMNLIRMRNAIREKVNELEALAITSPELMDLPISEAEKVSLDSINLYAL